LLAQSAGELKLRCLEEQDVLLETARWNFFNTFTFFTSENFSQQKELL